MSGSPSVEKTIGTALFRGDYIDFDVQGIKGGAEVWRHYLLTIRSDGTASLGLVSESFSPPEDWPSV